jgi:hypothetical protein
VFDPMTIVGAFDQLALTEFSFVDDFGDYIRTGDPKRFRGRLCCGLFLFTRRDVQAGHGLWVLE